MRCSDVSGCLANPPRPGESSMSVILGSGDFTYRAEEHWVKLPPGMVMGDVAALAVDRRDRVYLFNRGPNPMITVDGEGNFVDT